ncbi:hypothetical protein DPMN_054289 [Dreissena polymorpha]|uniref:Uncharacterized protein n=1 Tax=Dreissena polymorpha TaxID=45954 RepID=A0A9D4HRH6_DREPO|nr:hypothetical protein DPMN_054289 [Dreissena polymorpha]
MYADPLGQQLERARRDRGESQPQKILSPVYISLKRGTSAGGSANPAESVTLEPDVFYTARFAVFSKMQRTCHPLFIVESSLTRTCKRSRLKRAGNSGTAGLPVWRSFGADLELHLGVSAVPRTSRGGLREGPRGGGTQCAQRTGETVSGMKTTAGDDESGQKRRAVCCIPLAELRSDMNLS